MVEYTEKQRKIAKKLLEEPKKVEELRKELELNVKELNEELKKMINLGVVERKGDKYKLIEYIEKEMGKGPKLEGDYILRLIIEASGKEPKAVEEEMNILEEKLKKEPYKILEYEKADVETEEIEKDKENGEKEKEKSASTFIEAKITVPRFTDALYLIMSYGPSSVEVLKPEEIDLKIEEFQKSLNDLASAVSYYTGIIYQLKEELQKERRSKKKIMPSQFLPKKKSLNKLKPKDRDL